VKCQRRTRAYKRYKEEYLTLLDTLFNTYYFKLKQNTAGNNRRDRDKRRAANIVAVPAYSPTASASSQRLREMKEEFIKEFWNQQRKRHAEEFHRFREVMKSLRANVFAHVKPV
jgi:hypothetical protein